MWTPAAESSEFRRTVPVRFSDRSECVPPLGVSRQNGLSQRRNYRILLSVKSMTPASNSMHDERQEISASIAAAAAAALALVGLAADVGHQIPFAIVHCAARQALRQRGAARTRIRSHLTQHSADSL